MALSDYETLAVNEKAEPCYGEMESFTNSTLEIYKNWLYVRDPKKHHKGCEYTNNVIAQINSGNINISDFEIISTRVKRQGAIFVFARTFKTISTKPYRCRRKVFAGIGCRGYISQTDVLAKDLGIDVSEYDDYFQGWCSTGHITLTCIKNGNKKNYKFDEFAVPDTPENKEKYESKWVGISNDLFLEFIEWLGNLVDEEYGYDKHVKKWFRKVKKMKLDDFLGYNQGDLFFKDHGVVSGGVGKKIGDNTEPLIIQSLKESKKENEKIS